jgi:hypothetical protein
VAIDTERDCAFLRVVSQQTPVLDVMNLKIRRAPEYRQRVLGGGTIVVLFMAALVCWFRIEHYVPYVRNARPIVGGTKHSVLLTWVASPSFATSGYNVYRSNVSGTGYAKINSAPVSGLTYTDATVVNGQTYYYVTTAVDSSGDESTFSNQPREVIP